MKGEGERGIGKVVGDGEKGEGVGGVAGGTGGPVVGLGGALKGRGVSERRPAREVRSRRSISAES